ncbi:MULTISPECIES: hypothetical protein [unclassified Bradyrhizobium]|uniref:hypothetical protein n=1 Tax=unclassified Bradyrhizobium TaxID=2631580 RepID=UPI002FF24AA4
MLKADSVHSTPRLNSSLNNIAEPTATEAVDTSRRRFLSQAAAVTAGSAALATALSAPGPAAGAVQARDPIFAAIEAHKAALATWLACVDRQGDLEAQLPNGQCQSRITVWGEEIVETDDPRWIEGEREIIRTTAAADDAAVELLNIAPTTIAGLCALVEHAVTSDVTGHLWPENLVSSEGKARPWQHFLLENISEALKEGRLV